MYVVTGASAGIGKAVVTALAGRGLPVVAVARSEEPLNGLRDANPDSVTPVVADLSTNSGIEKVVASVGEVPVIDGLIHSAGSLVPIEPYSMIDPNALVEHFRIHVASQIALYQAIALRCSVARMMFVDSYSASVPRDGWAAYSIVKSAAQMAARCASQELSETAIVRVFPGAVKTQVVEAVLSSNTKTADVFAEMSKAGRVADPHTVALFIAALIVDASDELVRSEEAWDFNSAEHRSLVEVAVKDYTPQ